MPKNNQVEAVELGGSTSCSLDELIGRVGEKRRPLFVLLVLSLMAWWLGNPMVIYSPAFSGEVPSEWRCLTPECEILAGEWKSNGSSGLFPCQDQAEKVERFGSWKSGVDYAWIPKSNRTSFTIELDLVCRPFEKDMVSSIFFIGAMVGLLTGSVSYDHFGRRRSAIFGSVLVITSSVVGMFCGHYALLLTIRFIQGLGTFLAGTGMYIITSEILPSNYRNLVNGWAMNLWAVGNSVLALAAFLVQDWNQLFLTMAVFMAVVAIPQLYAPESPRYHTLQGDSEAAEAVIRRLARLNGVTLGKIGDLTTDPTEQEEGEEKTAASTSLVSQLGDLARHPVLVIETLAQMYLWFFVGMAYYAFNFGWGNIIPDPYLGYITAMIGELLAYTLFIPLVARIGRRFSMVAVFLLAAVAVFTALSGQTIAGDWTVGSVASLFGIVFVSAGFSGVWLWSSELAPTSHRGLVFSLCNVTCRLGSFLGPMMFNALSAVAGADVPIFIIGSLAVGAAGVSWFLVETGNLPIAVAPAEVAERRSKNWRAW